jgi:hypothetical protein
MARTPHNSHAWRLPPLIMFIFSPLGVSRETANGARNANVIDQI